ncbi:Zinc finger protein CONSTANS-LIKE 5 [Acorus gramineus]|uniref:Zinc finger protein CONSTANS-LIKE 5 n=1 Tax=Acorus gramineus TaxID=55184 RepID=A0AAV9AQV9_ACOGR|nr:Zinc finger protein CONSTANS-LIKE 5 [Acorus gramineus]
MQGNPVLCSMLVVVCVCWLLTLAFCGFWGDNEEVLSENQHHLANGSGGCSSPTPLTATSNMTSLDESTFKVGRLSVEEKKERINRFMKKRNERNFRKKIKYACRKTLADSRPRVRGRFAKNDEFGEATRPSSSHHEDEDDDEVSN